MANNPKLKVAIMPVDEFGNDPAARPLGSEADLLYTRELIERVKCAKVELPVDDSDLSESDLGQFFIDCYGAKFRRVSGVGVLHYNGQYWLPDNKMLRYSCAEIIQKEVVAATNSDQKERRRLKSKAMRNSMLDFALTNQNIVMEPADFENARHRLNTISGAIDLKTGKIESSKPEDYFLHITQCGYSTESPDQFMRFLEDIFKDDTGSTDTKTIHFIQRVLGYCITGEIREQKLFFCYGEGANGKSVLLDLINWMLGSYAINYPAAALMKQRNESHPTDLALLEGKRLAISPELERSQHWAESRIKELTGTETITARKMRQDFYEFPVTSKHVVCGNYEPALQGGDSAMQRRMIQIRFDQTIPPERRDPNLLDKLKGEADAIMGWQVRGAMEWYKSGLDIPEKVQRDSEAYFESMDDIGLWVEECCNLTGRDIDWTANKDLYQSYKEWKLDSGSKPLADGNWGREMRKRKDFHFKRENNQRGYAGITIKSFY